MCGIWCSERSTSVSLAEGCILLQPHASLYCTKLTSISMLLQRYEHCSSMTVSVSSSLYSERANKTFKLDALCILRILYEQFHCDILLTASSALVNVSTNLLVSSSPTLNLIRSASTPHFAACTQLAFIPDID